MFFFVLTVLWLLSWSALYIGFAQFKRRFREQTVRQPDAGLVSISIIIACKNESGRLGPLLKSLSAIVYPKDSYEIIFVDDASDDSTHEILKQYCDNSNSAARVISSSEKEFPGKKGALAVGVKNAVYPYIVITDADCAVPPDWLSGMASGFSSGFDVVAGGAPYYNTGGLLSNLVIFEYQKNAWLSFAFAGWGLPYTAAARNFGYSKKCYNQLGGYSNTIDRLGGDDDLFIREAMKNNFKIGFLTYSGYDVYTSGPATFKEYFNIRGRHVSTSHVYPLKIALPLALWHILNYLAAFGVFAAPWYPEAVVPFLVKFGLEITFNISINSSAESPRKAYNFTLPFLYEFLPPLNFLYSLRRKNNW